MSNGQGRAPPANRKTPPKGSTPAHTNDKDTKTRSHTDGFRRNNANYWNKREICRFYLYSSIIWFCPVLEELGK